MDKYLKQALLHKANMKLSNSEKLNDLNYTISLNHRCCDYIENVLAKAEDMYKLTDSDEDRDIVELLQYNLFALRYLSSQYEKSAKLLKKGR